MAQLITDLLLRALPVEPEHIRCTSVPGFDLHAGVHVSTQLRDELNDCVAVLGLLTPHSLDSPYVTSELGAGWGLRKTVVPILGPDFNLSMLRPPLSELHCIKFSDRTDWEQLIEELSAVLSLKRRPVPLFSPIIDQLCAYTPTRAKPDETPLQVSPKRTGFYAEIVGPSIVVIGKRAFYKAEFEGDLKFEWHYTQPFKLTDRVIFIELGYPGQTETLTLTVTASDGRTITTSKMITALEGPHVG